MQSGWCLALLWAVAAAIGAQPVAPGLQALDPVHSRVGFELHTRWGRALQGRFPRFDGEVVVRPDGRRQVRLQLHAASVEILGHPRYTQWARGPGFFDMARHPRIEFVSEPYSEALLHSGGTLAGSLTMLGVERPARFELAPAGCPQPGRDCDVVAHGTIDRTDYGMLGWRIALHDAVRFSLRVRVLGTAPEPQP